MCGIFGYVGPEIDAASLVFSGLEDLEYRGYDSWGIAVSSSGRLQSFKDVGKLSSAPSMAPGTLAIGHTRWATTGAVTHANAHPHTSCRGSIAIVHNGIVENHHALRDELRSRGHELVSETDTEVIAHLVEEHLLTMEQPNLASALGRVAARLDGLNAVVAIDIFHEELAAWKNGSPLYVGIGKDAHFVASDPAALAPHTTTLFRVADGQIVSVRGGELTLLDTATGEKLSPTTFTLAWRRERGSTSGFRTYLEKEIHEQPGILERSAEEPIERFSQLGGELLRARSAYLTGCGSAFHAALAATYLAARHTEVLWRAIHAHELRYFLGSATSRDLVLAISQSGETIDVLDVVRQARSGGVRTAAIVNVPHSSLTVSTDLSHHLDAGPERSVLSTKTFTAMVATLARFGAATGVAERIVREDLAAAASVVRNVLSSGSRIRILSLAESFVDREHLFLVGNGLSYPLALEGALKIKEVSYIHAEGFPTGELKHGVIALIEPGTPCIVLAPDGKDAPRALVAAEELKARGGRIIGIGAAPHSCFDDFVPVEGGDLRFFYGALTVLQLLALELAQLRGLDPDKPRNLAKSVTVR